MVKYLLFYILCLFCINSMVFSQHETMFKNHLNIKYTYTYLHDETKYPIYMSSIISQPSSAITIASSAVVPGLGQIMQGEWLRGAIYVAAEVSLITLYATWRNTATKRQQQYNVYVNNNWSVVKYAKWLVNYYDAHNLDDQNIDVLRTMVNHVSPSYNPEQEWQAIDISVLQSIERNTFFVSKEGVPTGRKFSHTLPSYGSQQYYELVSKYYQFLAGWRDYDDTILVIDPSGRDATNLFLSGVSQAEHFNNLYRSSELMLGLLLLNHFVSTIDAIITVKIKKKHQIKPFIGGHPSKLAGVNISL